LTTKFGGNGNGKKRMEIFRGKNIDRQLRNQNNKGT
jgi:hypothetical protein